MELNEEVLARLIREVVEEHVGAQGITGGNGVRVVDPSGIRRIDPTRVSVEPFPFPIPSPPGSVRLVDLLTVEESPRLGCGVMEMDATSFAWTLTYDEIDYVIDGTLEIIVDGRTVRASAGQVLYIPKNTSIQFSAPDKVRFFYVVYPANWFEQ